MMMLRRRAARRWAEQSGPEAFVRPEDRGGNWAARTQATPAAATTLRTADGGTQERVLTSLQGTSGNAAVQRLFGFGEDEEDEAEANEVGSTSGPIEEAPTETFAREQPTVEGPAGGSPSPGREQVGGQGVAEEESIEGVSEEQTTGPGEEATPGVSEEQTTDPGEAAGGSQDLADKVHAAGEGFGTDEAALFAALRSLGRDAVAVAALKATFARRFGQSLEDFLRDELSGDELEEALVLVRP